MIPDKATDDVQEQRDRNKEALDHLLEEIKNNDDATDREQRLASALVALRDS